jgi:RND family efflux transporter MFP subunit
MNRLLLCGLLVAAGLPSFARAENLTIRPTSIAEWKAVYGQVQARTNVLARARIGGTLTDLKVTEGDLVTAGEVIAQVRDEKIDFQIKAIEAQLLGLQASLNNAELELDRADKLIKSGATTAQRLDQLRTDVDVVKNQIATAQAERSVAVEQSKEGAVLAPGAGRVLTVPATRDAVVLPGETIATIGGGGFFLRLAVPERHAAALKQGALIHINTGGRMLNGTLAKIYPEIANGRVTADVEVKDLDTEFVAARVLVELPIGERLAIVVPRGAVTTRSGIDFVTVSEAGKPTERAVVTGQPIDINGAANIEILTGLAAGDVVVTP